MTFWGTLFSENPKCQCLFTWKTAMNWQGNTSVPETKHQKDGSFPVNGEAIDFRFTTLAGM